MACQDVDREAVGQGEERVCFAIGVEVLGEFAAVLAVANEPRNEFVKLGIGVVQDGGQFLADRGMGDEGQPDLGLCLRCLIQQGEFGQAVGQQGRRCLGVEVAAMPWLARSLTCWEMCSRAKSSMSSLVRKHLWTAPMETPAWAATSRRLTASMPERAIRVQTASAIRRRRSS